MSDAMKTYVDGERFPGRIGCIYADSEPAFPMPPRHAHLRRVESDVQKGVERG